MAGIARASSCSGKGSRKPVGQCFSTYCVCLLASQAGGTGPPEGLSAELEHVCPQSFAEHRRLRFPGCGDHSISNSLCVHPHGGWREAYRALKRHAYPTAVWTLQQFREAISSDYSYRFLIRDRDSIFSTEVDQQLKPSGPRVLRTPARAPTAARKRETFLGPRLHGRGSRCSRRPHHEYRWERMAAFRFPILIKPQRKQNPQSNASLVGENDQ